MCAANISLDRAKIVDQNFIAKVRENNLPAAKSTTTLADAGISTALALDIFDSQIESRHLDLIARILRKQDQAFYTIGSSGHEGNAAIAAAFNTDDMAFLHYRSCAFMLQRARQHCGDAKIYDHLLSLAASKSDPIASGRHKVFGSLELNVPPQTSTVASQLPKAVGAAFSVALAKELQVAKHLTAKSVILCSFGDASANHSTAQGAFNAVQWIAQHNLPLPLVFVCEDNGIGISVPTPADWIEKNFCHRVGMEYISCDGLNFCDTYKAAKQAEYIARTKKIPVFLHMRTVRLLGHAGSDIESNYHTNDEIIKLEADDPLLHSARILMAEKLLSDAEIIARYEAARSNIEKLAQQALLQSKLTSAEEVMASIIPPKLNDIRATEFTTKINVEQLKTLTMAQSINTCLQHLLEEYKNIVLFGEDVGKKGGVYSVTTGLQTKYGIRRVFDTLLDEQTILGTAIGLAHNGILPIPEIQFLAYIYNAIDQIRGEAATLSYFSNGQYTNPMVVRVAGLAYQKGFGGHFHNDNAIACLREIPGVIIACPSNGVAAYGLLRECVRLAQQEQRVVIFLEPIALYFVKDSYDYNEISAEDFKFDEPGIEDNGTDFLIISYGNGAHLSRQALQILSQRHNQHGTLLDLRWLAPLNMSAVFKAIAPFKKILIVDEGRKTGSISESILAGLNDHLSEWPKIHRITAEDCFIPLGNAWQYIFTKRRANCGQNTQLSLEALRNILLRVDLE